MAPKLLPWALADTLFQAGQENLSDMFDSSSLENTQSLFLMVRILWSFDPWLALNAASDSPCFAKWL
jgi:hypothetical protein